MFRAYFVDKIVMCFGTQLGKALSLDTPLPTVEGWTTMGAVRVGDRLFDEKGVPCTVIGATEVMFDHSCYKVKFSDGSEIISDAGHLWSVDTDMRPGKYERKILPTRDIAQTLHYRSGKGCRRNRYAVPVASPLVLPEKELPVDPYVLGVWLGDGCSWHSDITINAYDLEIVEHLKAAGHRVSVIPVNGAHSCTLQIDGWSSREICLHGHILKDVGVDKRGYCRECIRQAALACKWKDPSRIDPIQDTNKGLRLRLLELGILCSRDREENSKHIPSGYLRSSYEQRLALLQGLMDTDGHITTKGYCEITLTNRRLIADISELLSSLGIKHTFHTKKACYSHKGEKKETQAYRLTFLAYSDTPVFRLNRKKSRQVSCEGRRVTETRRRRIVEVSRISSVPVRCIMVDSPSHLYLAGRSMIPTHNTEAILNMMGYAIDQDPGAMLVVYPSDELAKSISKNRLQPMIEAVSSLMEKWERARSEMLELQFLGMYIALVGSNSPAKLSSRPVRYVFYDETDKFPSWSGREAAPSELASERSKNYTGRKEVHVSSPTLAMGHIWQEFLNVDVRKRYFVPCPHCNNMWTFKLRQIKWPESLNDEDRKEERTNRVLTESWYECEICGGVIHDMDKFRMLLCGEWRIVERDEGGNWHELKRVAKRSRSVGYNISSIYSPWITFGQVAQKFLQTKNEPAKFMNFVNGWLGEPWESEALKMRSDIVLERQSAHQRGTVPEAAQLLTCGIDVQKDHFWWVIRAWGPKMTSWLVDYGRCDTWGELDEMLDREYPQMGNEPMIVNIAFIDSGDRTDEVYQYCATQTGLVYPCKGASTRLQSAPCRESRVEGEDYGGMRLFLTDGHYYKSFIAGRIKRETDSPGSFNVCDFDDDIGSLRQYADQLCAEQLVTEVDKKGNQRESWKPIVSHAANHLLDAECYAIAAAERAGVRYLREE